MIKINQYEKKCNSIKLKCEYCSFIISFSWLKGHIKRCLEDIVLIRGAYSVNGIKPVDEFIKSKLFEDKSNSAFESNSTLSSIDKCIFFEDKSNSMDKCNFFEDKSNFLEDKCNFFKDNPAEPKYYKHYLLVSK